MGILPIMKDRIVEAIEFTEYDSPDFMGEPRLGVAHVRRTLRLSDENGLDGKFCAEAPRQMMSAMQNAQRFQALHA